MTITDKEVKRWIKQLKTEELVESIEEYPDDERDGRSDIQFFADEVSYIKSCFEEPGHAMNDDLEEARYLIRVTKNGKDFPWEELGYSLSRPMLSKDIRRIELRLDGARNTISEYKQLCYRLKKLHERGIYGQWENWRA